MRGIVACGLIMMVVAVSGCGAQPTGVPPTNTPRPTLPPRTAPTAIPTPADGGNVAVGEFVVVLLPGQTPVDVLLTVEAEQAVSITAAALTDDFEGNPLDPVLEVIGSENTRLAYDDDSGEIERDAAIRGLQLPPGAYIVRVNAFNGFQRGEIALRVEGEDELE